MNDETRSRIDILRQHCGETVTIIPNLGVGESRDTEPGAQPWQTTLVGVTLDGKPIIQDEGYDPRPMNFTDFKYGRDGHGGRLQFGEF